MVEILNRLTINQNEIISYQNRIATNLRKLTNVFREFVKEKDFKKIKKSKNMTEVIEKIKKKKLKNETLSFAEEMQELNKELNDIMNIVPKFD